MAGDDGRRNCRFAASAPPRRQAQDWAKAMFDRTTHDFGVVARGAKVEHRFVVENSYEEDAHIKSVSSSCGCSTPQVTKQLLKTWEKAEIVVTLDTRGFLGRKDATITVDLRSAVRREGATSRPRLHPQRHRGAAGRRRVRIGQSRSGASRNSHGQLRRPQRLADHAGGMRQSEHRSPSGRNQPHAGTGRTTIFR